MSLRERILREMVVSENHERVKEVFKALPTHLQTYQAFEEIERRISQRTEAG